MPLPPVRFDARLTTVSALLVQLDVNNEALHIAMGAELFSARNVFAKKTKKCHAQIRKRKAGVRPVNIEAKM